MEGAKTKEAIERAIRLAQEAVQYDEAGDLAEAIRLYSESVGLINQGLEGGDADNTTLQKYSKLYSDRITELRRSQDALNAEADASANALASHAGATAQDAFEFDDEDIADATPPAPAPTGHDEWRRPFWLMRILSASMQRGGYLSPDAVVFVPRRVWLQKGGKYPKMEAKLDCAQCLAAELSKVQQTVTDFRQSKAVVKELDRLGETMDTLQSSLAKLLPYVPAPKGGLAEGSSSMAKLTDRFRGLNKALDKTAARLGVTTQRDPAEYVAALVGLLDASLFLEGWMEHWMKQSVEYGHVHERFRRVAAFFYEVVCAFLVHDLNGLIHRHMKKSLASWLKSGADL